VKGQTQAVSLSLKEGGDQMEYEDQNPMIHKMWLEEMKKNGITPKMDKFLPQARGVGARCGGHRPPPVSSRHARACPGHPRPLSICRRRGRGGREKRKSKAWMPATSASMTVAAKAVHRRLTTGGRFSS